MAVQHQKQAHGSEDKNQNRLAITPGLSDRVRDRDKYDARTKAVFAGSSMRLDKMQPWILKTEFAGLTAQLWVINFHKINAARSMKGSRSQRRAI